MLLVKEPTGNAYAYQPVDLPQLLHQSFALHSSTARGAAPGDVVPGAWSLNNRASPGSRDLNGISGDGRQKLTSSTFCLSAWSLNHSKSVTPTKRFTQVLP